MPWNIIVLFCVLLSICDSPGIGHGLFMKIILYFVNIKFEL